MSCKKNSQRVFLISLLDSRLHSSVSTFFFSSLHRLSYQFECNFPVLCKHFVFAKIWHEIFLRVDLMIIVIGNVVWGSFLQFNYHYLEKYRAQWTIYIFIDILWTYCMCLCHGSYFFLLIFRLFSLLLSLWPFRHVVDRFCCQ